MAIRTERHLNIVILTTRILATRLFLHKRQLSAMETLIHPLKEVRTITFGAEHRVRRLKKRLVVAEETLGDILPVAGTLTVYAKWATVIGYHAHLVTYGADGALLFVETAVGVEAV